MNNKGVPDLVILAGPNGCGKTTVADFLLENKSIERFINADIIAKGLSISSHQDEGEISAGRIMLADLKKSIVQQKSIAFEATMAGRSWIKIIQGAKDRGYHITICFVVLSSADLAIQRIVQRVQEGGHYIPDETVKRRYERSLSMFFDLYRSISDTWYFFDNTSHSACLLAQKEEGRVSIFDEERFNVYERFAQKSRN